MNKIYVWDIYDTIKQIESESIDLIITDPPYWIWISKEWDNENIIIDFVDEFYRILKPNGQLFIFAWWSNVCNTITSYNNKFHLNDWIIYDRIKWRWALRRLVSTREDLLWFVKNKKEYTFNKDKAYSTIKKKTWWLWMKNWRDVRALSNVWTDISPIVPWSKERFNHPTQKPEKIIDRIIDVFSNEWDVIYDPFAWTWTTWASAIKLGRNYILWEKNEEYIEIINNRIK